MLSCSVHCSVHLWVLVLQFSLCQDECSAGGPRHALPAKHVYAKRKPFERQRRSLGRDRDVSMQQNAIAPCECREWIGLVSLLNVCFARTSTALNKETWERGISHITLFGTLTVVVPWHPVTKYVASASLAIVVTLQKGSDASFLVQVGTVHTYECHNICVCIVWTRPLSIFFPLPCAIGSPRFGSQSSRACPLAVNDGGVCWSLAFEAKLEILLCGVPRLSLGLQWFLLRLLSFRIRQWIPGLGRFLTLIIFGFCACIMSIWIWDSERVAGSCACNCRAKHNLNTYNLYTVLSRSAGESLLCWAVWRIHPLKIVIGESKVTRTGLPDPPLYLEKRKCVSTSLMPSAASCTHQDTRHLHE